MTTKYKDLTGVVDGSLILREYLDDDSNSLDKSLFSFYGNNSTFDGAGDWVAGLGAPAFDINTTVAGKLYAVFDTNNEQIKLVDKVENGFEYTISIKAQLLAGDGCEVIVGLFTSALNSPKNIKFRPTATEQTFTGRILSEADLSIGVLDSDNNGSTFCFDDIKIVKLGLGEQNHENRITDLELAIPNVPASFNTDTFMMSLSQYDKPLTKICVNGDSLMGNAIGGIVPIGEDEGLTMRPFRMGYNNVARRLYDELKFNPATHRRIDHADFTKSGTWTSFMDTTVMEPVHANEAYHKSIVSGAYIEITVPDGQENFAFIAQQRVSSGTLVVTLNGGDISSYGNSSVNLAIPFIYTGDIGNPYHVEQYLGLPSGDNVIRIAKQADTLEVRLWGGFYWSGNSMIVQNIAHGGHNMTQLIRQHMQHEMTDNDFDAILFELPIMNDTADSTDIDLFQGYVESVLGTYAIDKDILFMTTNPFGDNGAGTNYYTLHSDPQMTTYNERAKNVLYSLSSSFVDIFSIFKTKIENRGGTLAGGEGGLYYTDDGQHPNEDGNREWFNLLRFLFTDKPIKY